ncbi:hypothetical protein H7F51_00900 [Novosphingobium flavum]|uniref:Uncharacterized protein n=1 Tax=Novosphingobium flavum TaxID=1778672 RepID=A0A7X1FNL4_9SPHN|nr:hypothetical protein [Novosphingobium flavum]MBC2664068.1 hypothetical protein [Novosphingobium flavum]
MRSTSDEVTVRLYHLDTVAMGGAATTLFYGPLSAALRHAAQQASDIQDDLWIATDNDVVAYRDLAEG